MGQGRLTTRQDTHLSADMPWRGISDVVTVNNERLSCSIFDFFSWFMVSSGLAWPGLAWPWPWLDCTEEKGEKVCYVPLGFW